MNARPASTWIEVEANQKALNEELGWLRRLLEDVANGSASGIADTAPASTPTLNFLSNQLRLSEFERNIALLCAGIELDSYLGHLCASAQTDPRCDYPSFGLALAVLPEAHLSVLSPQAPLRHWQIVQLSDPTQITSARLTIDERILHFLLGTPALDTRLAVLTRPLRTEIFLAPTQQLQVARIERLLSNAETNKSLIMLKGDDLAAAHAVAASACEPSGMPPLFLRATDLPSIAAERNFIAHLLTREFLLSGNATLVEATNTEAGVVGNFLELIDGPVMLIGDIALPISRTVIPIEINKPLASERADLWRTALNKISIDDVALARVADQFNFSAGDIAAAAKEVCVDGFMDDAPAAMLWQSCRLRSRGKFDHLAQLTVPSANWEELVLPQDQLDILLNITRQMRHRATVFGEWDFARSGRCLCINALFVGESGTGKTLAAEIIAADLGVDLCRVDLAAVVSKYIGETGKNIQRVFDIAEESGAVLLFDEADALIEKRGRSKENFDRYDNIELVDLLQRMQDYRGVSILTTASKSLLDPALLRRTRFVVEFPFPNKTQRTEIWRRVFPAALPRGAINIDQLAQLKVTGGNIRNIAINGAFMAAEEGKKLDMTYLLRAARMEYAKLEKTPDETEIFN